MEFLFSWKNTYKEARGRLHFERYSLHTPEENMVRSNREACMADNLSSKSGVRRKACLDGRAVRFFDVFDAFDRLRNA